MQSDYRTATTGGNVHLAPSAVTRPGETDG